MNAREAATPARAPDAGGPPAFLDLCRRRFSCRAYRPDPVPRGHLDLMLEAARAAPSSCNTQPWRFAVVCDEARRRALATRGLLPGLSAAWVGAAPVIVVLGARRDAATHRLAPLLSGVDYAALDVGIAGEHLVLQAAELGLATCWIGWIRAGAVRRIVGWRRAIAPVAMFTVGWPAEGAKSERPDRLPRTDLESWIGEQEKHRP